MSAFPLFEKVPAGVLKAVHAVAQAAHVHASRVPSLRNHLLHSPPGAGADEMIMHPHYIAVPVMRLAH